MTKKLNCDAAREQLIGYIEGELDSPMRNTVEEHLADCPACRQEQRVLLALRSEIRALPVTDPGEDFWREFPRRVQRAYRVAERDAAQTAQSWRERWRALLAPRAWAAVAFTLSVALSAAWFLIPSSMPAFDSAAFQARIENGDNLASLAAQQNLPVRPSGFGFADPYTPPFFTIGSLYAQTLALARGADRAVIEARLELISGLLRDTAPAALRESVRGATSAQALASLQRRLEDYAGTFDQQIWFQAGAWLIDMRLAAAAREKRLLEPTPQLDYLRAEFKRRDAPVGARESLDELARLLDRTDLSDADVARIEQIINRIQAILI